MKSIIFEQPGNPVNSSKLTDIRTDEPAPDGVGIRGYCQSAQAAG